MESTKKPADSGINTKSIIDEVLRETWRMKPKISKKLPPAFSSVQKT